jgi:hypothetical protein
VSANRWIVATAVVTNLGRMAVASPVLAPATYSEFVNIGLGHPGESFINQPLPGTASASKQLSFADFQAEASGTAVTAVGSNSYVRADAMLHILSLSPLMRLGAEIDAWAEMKYSVAVTPVGALPPGVFTVPVLFSTSGDAQYLVNGSPPQPTSSAWRFEVGSGVNIGNLFADDAYVAADTSGTTTIPHDAFNISASVNFIVDTEYRVTLGAYLLNCVGAVGGNGEVSYSLSAQADPTFIIDPSFPYASDFQLIYSSNVPEPASFVSIGTALFAATMARKRKRGARA